MNSTWRATVAGLQWATLPRNWAIEAYGKQAAIVRISATEMLCTLSFVNARGDEPYSRWTFEERQLDNTKARIIRHLGVAE